MADAVGEVFRTRVRVPGWEDGSIRESALYIPPKATRRKRTASQEKQEFDLYKSVWAGRAAFNDSNDVFDTEDVEMRRFANDWTQMCTELKLANFVMRNDDEGMIDLDGDGVPGALMCLWAVPPFPIPTLHPRSSTLLHPYSTPTPPLLHPTLHPTLRTPQMSCRKLRPCFGSFTT